MAGERAKLCRAVDAEFAVLDVRRLDTADEYIEEFDVVLCMENIEHICDDRKLMKDMAHTLRPGGRLLLSTPNLLFRSMSGDVGPYSEVKNGGHVRGGYNRQMLTDLCEHAGLRIEEISYCGGPLIQKITGLQRSLSSVHPLFAWAAILPLRLLPLLFDSALVNMSGFPGYSICLEAYKRRFQSAVHQSVAR